MAISFNTGTTATSGAGVPTTLGITIPAGVLAGDVIVVAFTFFNVPGGGVTVTASSTGTAPVLILNQNTSTFGSNTVSSGLFYVVASATDAGKVITGANGGTAGNWVAGLGAWTGANNATPIDVSASNQSTGASATETCPSATTGVANDWDLQIVCAALGGATWSGGAGFTQREAFSDGSSGATVLIFDSNASVGPAGTGIGGAAFTNAGHNNWWAGYTVGLEPAAAAAVSGTVQPLATFPVLRRKPARAFVQFTPVKTINTGHGPAGTVQPRAVPAAMPRRRLSRAAVQFIPVKTVNNPNPPPPPTVPLIGGGRSFVKRSLLWADL